MLVQLIKCLRISRPEIWALRISLSAVLLSWGSALGSELAEWRDKMQSIVPKGYLCRHTTGPIEVDGKLDEAAWAKAPWTSDFQDIEGSAKPKPRFTTRAKMLWDDKFLYIAAELEEPHVWATLTNHDSVIFNDPDFEVFIDPAGVTQPYVEFEMNALNTTWDLMLDKPYIDSGKPHDEWEIRGARSAVQIRGTINEPTNTDRGWTVELAFPWTAFRGIARHEGPPKDGEQWRMDFSRVEWQISTTNGNYKKIPGKPEDNWVWSPTGVVDMHRPEMWGQVQFTRSEDPGGSSVAPIAGKAARDMALSIYHAQLDFWKMHQRWATNLVELGLNLASPTADAGIPVLEVTKDGYTCSVPFEEKGNLHIWRVRQDRLLKLDEPLAVEPK